MVDGETGAAGGMAAAADGEVAADPPSLEARLALAEQESRENYDRFLRERAELDNFKKRMQRERAEAVRYATEPLLRDLIPVVDNLERALAHAQAAPETLLDGVKLVNAAFVDALARHGVTQIDATGQKFDPAVHEAMAMVPSTDHEPSHVVDQHCRGYKLHDRLLRPAMVTVSVQKNDEPVETSGDRD